MKTAYYSTLGVAPEASGSDIRAAFRKLVLTKHPDHGGSEEEFQEIQTAYEVLSDPRNRRIYDRFGPGGLKKDSESLFAQAFRGGSFAPESRASQDLRHEVDSLRKQNESLQRKLMIVKPDQENSFATSFEAWMRNRDPSQTRVITTEDLIREHGVEPGSYEARSIPKLKSFALEYTDNGKLSDAISLREVELPTELKWGEVLVKWLAAPVTVVDHHLAGFGMIPGEDTPPAPFIAGAQGVGVVLAVGDGVEALTAHDLVMANTPLCGTWRPLAVVRQSSLNPFPRADISHDLLGNFFAFVTAYRLLEDFGALLPGDTVIQSAPASAVGQAVIQLCQLLQIKTINLVDPGPDFDDTSDMLHAIGATHVWKNEHAVVSRVNKRGLARPRLAIDALGGPTLSRMLECLRTDSTLVTYGAQAHAPLRFPHKALLYEGIQIQGFWLYKWLREKPERFAEVTDLLLPLMEEGKLSIEASTWERLDESYEGMLQDTSANVMLKFGDMAEASKLITKISKPKSKPKAKAAKPKAKAKKKSKKK